MNILIPLIAITLIAIPVGGATVLAADTPGIPGVSNFDINACYASCGCHYGLFGTCFECKQNCERQYWREFDRATSGKKSRGYSSSF
ncbi:hypothetical protein [Desulfomonile tiedjei]|uniref:Uncharacterized protein n=1 Tax=Desulfomonile tiedjei (strain ATCC 49306 / DSM 6799 / DCB-1) TaxID=706587 RepID=I4C7U4_DESTA|nr:hypothetical protein [Desulfomonile tiedjei]AFM25635.1 hypothetical protein Desti_2966 [Desulfomonile tiedjei DSM 6799]